MSSGGLKRPALRYYGAKYAAAKQILEYAPQHTVYADPFGGGAGMFWKKPRVGLEIYNDLSSDVVNFFRQLRNNPDTLLRAIYLTPYAREELQDSLQNIISVDEDAVEAARQFFIRSWMTIQGEGVGNLASNFRGSRTSGTFFPPSISDLYACAERFKNVVIENTDAFRILEKYDSATTWFYVDPPYIGAGECYTHQFTEHAKLADVLHHCEAYVAISSLDDATYNELYWDWYRTTIAIHGTSRSAKTEVLWLNYTL